MPAQSPHAGRAEKVPYFLAWAATTRLMAEGLSFSGRERNSLFLNLGGGRFADVSALSGFDFPDDSRAVAETDWDFDGRPDLWLAGRSGPRLRLLHNRWPAGTGTWLSLRLIGKDPHRDAIGARLVLTLRSATGAPATMRRTVRAGEGFMTQSSLWQTIGLPSGSVLENVEVHWPGGKATSFTGLEPNKFWRLSESTGRAERWSPPVALALHSEPLPPAVKAATTRVIMAARPLFPDVKPPAGAAGHIVSLWSLTCAPCREEIAAWSHEAGKFEKAGLVLTLLNAESDPPPDRSAQVAALWSKLQVPFPQRELTAAEARRMDLFQRTLTDQQRPLAFPATFLIDAGGHLVAAWTGPVSADEIIDLSTTALAAPPAEWRDLAVPFPGRWLAPAETANPTRYAMRLDAEGESAAAAKYLTDALAGDVGQTRASSAGWLCLAALQKKSGHVSESHASLARAAAVAPGSRVATLFQAESLLARGMAVEADSMLATLDPEIHDARTLGLMGLARLGQQQFAEALRFSLEALTLDPQNAELHYQTGFVQQQLHNHLEAIRGYRAALVLEPSHSMARTQLAWLLATSSVNSLRSGSQALTLATSLTSDPGASEPLYWMSLAAAYAETGDFPAALTSVTQGLNHARTAKAHPSIVARLERQKTGYAAGKPARTRAISTQ